MGESNQFALCRKNHPEQKNIRTAEVDFTYEILENASLYGKTPL